MSLYPFLGCHLHVYLIHFMHKLLFSPSVLMNRVPYLFPPNFTPRQPTTSPEFYLTGIILAFSFSLVYLLPASYVSSPLSICLSVGLVSRTPSLSIIGWLLPVPRTLDWTSLDSVPLVLGVYVFPSMMMWSLPFPPSNIRLGSLLLQ